MSEVINEIENQSKEPSSTTPQTSLPPAAPVASRIMAYLIDLTLISIVNYGLALGAIFLFFGGLDLNLDRMLDTLTNQAMAGLSGLLFLFGLLLVLLLILAVVHDGYFIYWEYAKGTTLGKRLFGLKVHSLLPGRLTLGQVIVRHLMRYIDCALLIPGLVCILVTPKRQRLGDLAAGTMVVVNVIPQVPH